MDSKISMVVLMNYLGSQWENVRVVNVNPGGVKTKMTKGSGMPSWLLPIRNLFFLSPQRGVMSLYNAAFNKKYEGSNIFISEGRVRPLQLEITAKEVEQFLA